MLKKEVARGANGRVVIMDSITKVTPEDAGGLVVSASHGGASSGEFALEVPLKAAFFNDAGVGKEDAGIAALAMLQASGVAGGRYRIRAPASVIRKTCGTTAWSRTSMSAPVLSECCPASC